MIRGIISPTNGRVGQKNGQVYQWAPKGTRPRQTTDQRYENAYMNRPGFTGG